MDDSWPNVTKGWQLLQTVIKILVAISPRVYWMHNDNILHFNGKVTRGGLTDSWVPGS